MFCLLWRVLQPTAGVRCSPEERPRNPTRHVQIIPRRSVAVLGFRNLPGRPDEDWLATAFSEMLSTELAAGGGLRMVSDEDVSRAKRDLQIGDAETLAKSTLASLRTQPRSRHRGGRFLHADRRERSKTPPGGYPTPGHALGETIAEEAFSGDEQTAYLKSRHRRARVCARGWGLAPASAEAMNAARASLPSNQQAARLYAEGRAKLWDFDFLAARDLLLKAVAADPGNAAAHLALADAWSALGYGATAQEQAKQAFDLSAKLSSGRTTFYRGPLSRTHAATGRKRSRSTAP